MRPELLPELLLPWFESHRRELPWRADREPYHIWLSEIMLQQTRVEAVKGYYARFLAECPDIPALARCPEDRLNKLWEGLGYYSRVRNLRKAAVILCEKHGGQFPTDYDSIRALPGIGDYTAGAICSICFGLPTPAVDGNVLRVYTRYTGCESSVSSASVKKEISDALAAVYPAGDCGSFTQALMELGATVCLPNGEPSCRDCPLNAQCFCGGNEKWRELPKKAPKPQRRKQQKTVLLLHDGNAWAIQRRPKTGLLAGLWEFPNTDGFLTVQEAVSLAAQWGFHPSEPEKELHRTHVFTHIEWDMVGYRIKCAQIPEPFTAAGEDELDRVYSLPTAFRQFREQRDPTMPGASR